MTGFYNTDKDKSTQPDSSQDLKGFYGTNVRPADVLNYVKMAQDAAKRSEEARDESRAARDESQGYAQDSANSATASEASRVAAEAAQTGAETAETNASNSATLAATEANRATTQADRAESEADRAEQYANSMAHGMIFKGNWDASTNTFPTPTLTPEKADYYVISVGGTITGSGSQPTLELLVGDNIVWHVDDDIWIRISSRVVGSVSAALQAQRNRIQDMFAANGFVHYGKNQIASSSVANVNEGMHTQTIRPNVLYLGRGISEITGQSKTNFPVTHIAGFISQLYLSSDSGYDGFEVKLPEAPDGTVTYDSSSGVVVNHPDSATAFAAETETNKVVINRVDMYGAEYWLETITTTNPYAYPYGLPQQLATTVDGIATGDSNRPATYYAWYDGDTGSKGKGWNFFALSVIEQDAILNNPDHNVYYSNGQYLQWRARGKSFAGVGNGDWANVDPLNPDALASVNRDVTAVTPQGMLDTPTDNSGWVSYFAGYGSTNNPDENLGVFTTNSTATSVTHTYFHVWGQVSRLNQGAYHPSYNSLGTRKFRHNDGTTTTAYFWYQSEAYQVTSSAECFDVGGVGSKVHNGTGYIGTPSGHSDGLFYDAIYPSGQGGVLDDRLPAWDMGGFEEAMKVDLKVKNGTYRGKQKLPFTRVYAGKSGGYTVVDGWGLYYHDSLPAGGIFSVYANGSIPEITSGEVGDFISVTDASNRVLHGIIYSKPLITQVNCYVLSVHPNFTYIYNNGDFAGWHLMSPQTTDLSVEGNIDNGFIVQDIIGDPAEIVATPELTNGWQGYWVPVIPDGTSKDYPFTRKVITSTLLGRQYTSNNGVSWSNSTGLSFDITKNARTSDAHPANRVEINTYQAMPYVVEDGTNDEVFNGSAGIGKVSASSWYNPNGNGFPLLAEALINKVLTSSQGFPDIDMNLAVTSATPSPSGALNADVNALPRHTAIELGAPSNNSPAVKALVYQTSTNQRLGLNYAFNEMKWSSPTFSTITMATTANHPKGTLVFISDGLYQGHYVAEVASFGGSSFQSYADTGSMYLGEGGSIYGASGELAYRKLAKNSWGDDGTIQIADGISTGTNLVGETILIGTKSLTKPYGYSRNQARISTQVEGIDL